MLCIQLLNCMNIYDLMFIYPININLCHLLFMFIVKSDLYLESCSWTDGQKPNNVSVIVPVNERGDSFLHSRENNFSWDFCFRTHWKMSESPSLSNICHLKHEKTLSFQHNANTALAAGRVKPVNHWMSINDCSSVILIYFSTFTASAWM